MARKPSVQEGLPFSLILRPFTCLCFVIGLFPLTQCSQRMLRLDPSLQTSETDGKIQITLPLEAAVLEKTLEDYLVNMNRLESSFRDGDTRGLMQTWERAQSLRYYLLEFDRKQRHICEWKSLWKIKALHKAESQLELETLEILYIGAPSAARGGPASKNPRNPRKQTSWFETSPDRVRSAVEMRRFMKSSFPEISLPLWLTEFKVPELKGQALTLKKELNSEKWRASVRKSAF